MPGPRQTVLVGGIFGLVALAAALHVAVDEPVATFLASGVALAGLAWLVGVGTEALGAGLGPAATGVLQSTLGNLPELFIVLFALGAGETVVARTSILGSLFANALLVLGLAIVAGARESGDGVMRFQRRLPNDTATLLVLAVSIIVLLGLSDRVGDRASAHQVTISALGALLLLSVYGVWLYGYLRGGGAEPALETSAVTLSLPLALGLLAAAGVAAAFVSDWFVGALDPAVAAIGISKAFTGLVIVGIAGNAVENVVGVTLAAKGQADLAVSVVKNSVSQIAVFLFPALVLLSLLFEHRLTFVLDPVAIGALALTALAVWQITSDGEAAAFEGWALVALYGVIAVLAWYE